MLYKKEQRDLFLIKSNYNLILKMIGKECLINGNYSDAIEIL